MIGRVILQRISESKVIAEKFRRPTPTESFIATWDCLPNKMPRFINRGGDFVEYFLRALDRSASGRDVGEPEDINECDD
jgi:hypothetical protein